MLLADQIRKFVQLEYIEPARKQRQAAVTVVAGDVHKKMALRNRLPAVCAALRSKALQQLCNVPAPKWAGPVNGATASATFTLNTATDTSESPQVPEPERPITEDELMRLGRRLERFLRSLAESGSRREGVGAIIARLKGGLIPREIAACMRVISEMRNAVEHHDKRLSGTEGAAVRSAWRAVEEWARSAGLAEI